MRRICFQKGAQLAIVMILLLLSAPTAGANQVTIIGVVNDYMQLESGGQVYEIMDTAKGNDLVDHIGEKVKVTGTFEEHNQVQMLNVKSYEVVND